jgi:hypothetical protein
VVHDLRAGVLQQRADGGRVADVDPPRHAVRAEHLVARGLEVLDQMPPDEAARAGDQR